GCSEALGCFTSPHAASTTTVSNKATAAPIRRNVLIVHLLQPAPSHRPARRPGQPDQPRSIPTPSPRAPSPSRLRPPVPPAGRVSRTSRGRYQHLRGVQILRPPLSALRAL